MKARKHKVPKRGRPALPADERRNVRQMINFTPDEYDAIVAAAELLQLSVPAFMRLRILYDLRVP
jgi:hypothetical protein